MGEAADKTTPDRRKKKVALGVFAAFWLIAALAVFLFMRYKSTHISTDDAFIEGRVHAVASKIPGTVKAVHVSDNQPVKKGDLLIELDEADYEVKEGESKASLEVERARLLEARSRLEAAGRQLSELGYRVSAARAGVEAARATLAQAELDLKRAEGLLGEEAISRERYEKTKTAYELALAQSKGAEEQLLQAEAAVSTQSANMKQLEAAVRTSSAMVGLREAGTRAAGLNLSYAKLRSPADGFVTRKSVQEGNQIQPGQPLMAVVPLDDIWITANYKETQLEKIGEGMKVRIRVDAYPDMEVTGKVQSIMAGTGSVFSLFPPENATGNFVKVVQRVPVRISIDTHSDPGHVLRVGMSVVPTVIVE